MNDAKPAKKKTKIVSKKGEAAKLALKKSEAAKADTGKAETSKTDTPAKKSEAAGKSKSQESISYFSSVSTPEYRSGWDHIFGPKKKLRK